MGAKAKSKPFLQSMAEFYAEHTIIRALVGLVTTVVLAVVGVMMLSLVLSSLANTLVNMATSMPLAGKVAEFLVNHVAPFFAGIADKIAPGLASLLGHMPIIPAISTTLALGIVGAIALVLLYTALTAHKAAEGASKEIEAQKKEQEQEQTEEPDRAMRKGRSNQETSEADVSERASASRGEEVEMVAPRRSGPQKRGQ